ncbi:hypothetical protein [Microcystis phage Mwe-JY25]
MGRRDDDRKWRFKPSRRQVRRDPGPEPASRGKPARPIEIVSDHALVRWLERVHGVDIEAFRAILRDEVRPLSEAGVRIQHLPDRSYVFGRDGVLVTVLTDGERGR